MAPRHWHAADDHQHSLHVATAALRFAYLVSTIEQPRIGWHVLHRLAVRPAAVRQIALCNKFVAGI
jgi:hypothetical protein